MLFIVFLFTIIYFTYVKSIILDGRACPYRGRGWYCVCTGSGSTPKTELGDRYGMRSASALGQGMVRAQRRLVRLSEGQKRRGDRQALRRRHGCRPEGAVHHLSYRPAKSGAEGHGGAVIIKTGCPSAQKVRGDFLWIPPQAQSRKGYVHTFPQKAGLQAGQSSALCKK